MSTIPALVHPQDDPHFVGTLHLRGALLEEVSASLPPPYETLIAPSVKNLKLSSSNATEHSMLPKLEETWGTLLKTCETSKANLDTLRRNLEASWFKQYLLKEEKARIREAIDTGFTKIQAVYTATRALCEKDEPVNLNVLKHALKDLQTFEPAVSSFASPTPQTPIRTEPTNWCFEKIKEYLVPIVLMGWGLITQSGLLSADTAKAIPVIGALISIALKIKENYQNFMREAKTEDIRKLMEIRNTLVEIFMNVHDIDNTFQGRVQTDLMRKTHQSVIDNAFQARDQIAAIEGRLAGLEKSIALLLKKSNIPDPTDNKNASDPA